MRSAQAQKGGGIGGLVLLLLFIIFGCNDEQPRNTTSRPTTEPATSPRVVSVSKNDVGKPWSGDKWPFTVAGGQVMLDGCCSVVFRYGGVTYAVNGTARTAAAGRGWSDFTESGLWRDAPSGYGKVSIGPIIDLGLSLR